MSPITIRKMTREDLPQVMSLYKQPDMDDGRGLDSQTAAKIMDEIDKYPFYQFYVATLLDSSETSDAYFGQREKTVGVFGLLIMNNLGHMGALSAVVEGVCVDPDFQGQGIGKEMMEWAMKLSRERGCYKLALTSNLKRDRAHAFYESLGFEQHGLSFQIKLDQ